MTRIRTSALSVISCSLLLLVSCSSADSADEGAQAPVIGPPPTVLGGQTGALMPPCGLTPAARNGDSIPGGDSGIVIHTQTCAGFAVAELELRNEAGMPVEFDVETLPGGAVLLRPRTPLAAGVYRLKVAGMEMAPVVAEQPPALPMLLGTLQPIGPPSCAGNVALNVHQQLLPYLPQLKLSVSIDGGENLTWFDYGELDVMSGRANLSLPPCIEQHCLTDGAHTLRVTGELAGELGTLAPVDVDVQTLCQTASTASAANAGDGGDDEMDCGVAPSRRGPAGDCALYCLAAALGLLAVRRARRSSA